MEEERAFYVSLQNDFVMSLLKNTNITEFRIILGIISKCNSYVRAFSNSNNSNFQEQFELKNECYFDEDINFKDIKSLVRNYTRKEMDLIIEIIQKIEVKYIKYNKKYNIEEPKNFQIFECLILSDDIKTLEIKFNEEYFDEIFFIENEYRIDNIDLCYLKKLNNKYEIFIYLFILKKKSFNDKMPKLKIEEIKKVFTNETFEINRNMKKAFKKMNIKYELESEYGYKTKKKIYAYNLDIRKLF